MILVCATDAFFCNRGYLFYFFSLLSKKKQKKNTRVVVLCISGGDDFARRVKSLFFLSLSLHK